MIMPDADMMVGWRHVQAAVEQKEREEMREALSSRKARDGDAATAVDDDSTVATPPSHDVVAGGEWCSHDSCSRYDAIGLWRTQTTHCLLPAMLAGPSARPPACLSACWFACLSATGRQQARPRCASYRRHHQGIRLLAARGTVMVGGGSSSCCWCCCCWCCCCE